MEKPEKQPTPKEMALGCLFLIGLAFAAAWGCMLLSRPAEEDAPKPQIAQKPIPAKPQPKPGTVEAMWEKFRRVEEAVKAEWGKCFYVEKVRMVSVLDDPLFGPPRITAKIEMKTLVLGSLGEVQRGVREVFEAVASRWPRYHVRIQFYYPMQDRFGNVSPTRALQAKLPAEAAQKIYWENITAEQLWNLLKFEFLHPAFLELKE